MPSPASLPSSDFPSPPLWDLPHQFINDQKWRKIMPVKYPEEIQKLIDIFEPYMIGCHLENAPKEAIEAAEKF